MDPPPISATSAAWHVDVPLPAACHSLCLFQNQQNQPKSIRIGENWREIVMKGVCLIRTPSPVGVA